MIEVVDADPLHQAVLGVQNPVSICTPRDTDELAALLAAADQAGQAVVPWGGGTQQRYGAPPARCDLILKTGQLAGIIAYAPEDLTVSVRAGTTLAEVDALLAQHGQFLPLDLPRRQHATIGGVLATNGSPVRRHRYGGARDLVIGVEVAIPSGAICKSGGRVVKNVAGYDLCKLFVGSLGTLGVIVSANFKVQPLPRALAVIDGAFANRSAALRAGRTLAQLGHGCSAIVAYQDAGDPACTLRAVAEGFGGTVTTVVAAATQAIQSSDGATLVSHGPDAATMAIGALAEWRVVEDVERTALLRGAVPPAEIGQALDRLLGLAQDRSLRAGWQVDLATGTLFARLATGGMAAAELARTILDMRTLLHELRGHLVLADSSLALRKSLDVWGGPPDAERLARTIKSRIDPHRTLNPGRYVYGM